MVHQHKPRHRLDDRHSAREDAWIMAATAFESGVVEFRVHGLLLVHDRGHGLEGDAEINGFTVGDPALDSTGTIGGSANLAALDAESIVVLRAGQKNPA